MRASRLRTRLYHFLATLPALCMAASAQAMSYVPMADTPLLDQAGLVVLGEVAEVAPAPGHELDATRYSLNVEQVLKGAVETQSIGILVPGAQDSTRTGALSIPGTPRIAVGERVLAFLDRRDGDYVLVHLSLGAFHVRTSSGGTEVLVRDLDQADAIETAAALPTAATTRLRDLGKFTAWLRRKAAGQAATDDYWSDEPLADAPLLLPRFTVASPPARWFQFDNGGSVPFYASSIGQLGLPGGGYSEFQQALAAWNNNGAGKVNYVYGGLTNAIGDLAHPDGVNKILFNDLSNFIGGVFDCINGGVAGYGGWRSGPAQSFNGASFQPIVEGDVIIRNGAGCLLSRNANANATELFGHELGHTLGLGHPCGDPSMADCIAVTPQDDALMRPYLHGDGRGARLGTDDLQGIAFLYPQQASQGSGNGQSGVGDTSGNGSGGGGAFDPLLGGLLVLAWWLGEFRRKRVSPLSGD